MIGAGGNDQEGGGDTAARVVLHASCVALQGRGLLICGASGSGKSALALTLMALGAGLVADDRVIVTRQGARLMAAPPQRLLGLIEARGIGLLNAEPQGPAALALAVDLDRTEPARLPARRESVLLGRRLPLFYKIAEPHFAAGLLQYLKAGIRDGI